MWANIFLHHMRIRLMGAKMENRIGNAKKPGFPGFLRRYFKGNGF
jgi:hypothetical protein